MHDEDLERIHGAETHDIDEPPAGMLNVVLADRSMEIKQLEPMWTTERERFVLFRVVEEDGGVSYLPYDLATRTAVVIENPSVEAEAVSMMLAAGVQVTDKVPDPKNEI